MTDLSDRATEKKFAENSADAANTGDVLTITEAQKCVDDWIQKLGVRYFHEMTNLAQLVEEVGELARLFSRTKGEQSFRKGTEPDDITASIADEMADVLFVLICLANQSGIDLNEALIRNLDKKSARDATRHFENEKLQSTDPPEWV